MSVEVVSSCSLTDAVHESSFCCFSPCLLVHEDTSVRCVQGSSQFAFWQCPVEPDVSPHLNPDRTDCVGVQRSVISIVSWLVRDSSSFLTSLRVIVNHTPSADVIIVFDNYLHYLCICIDVTKVVAEQELQSTEYLERNQDVQRAAELHKRQRPRLIETKSLLQVTPYHGDKASFLGWKWSFLIAVRAISKPLCEGLKKIEDNKSGFPKIPIVHWRSGTVRSGVHTVSVALQR